MYLLITLHGLNVTAAEFELIGRAGVPKAVKDHLRKMVVRNEFGESPVNKIRFRRRSLCAGKHKIIVSIL